MSRLVQSEFLYLPKGDDLCGVVSSSCGSGLSMKPPYSKSFLIGDDDLAPNVRVGCSLEWSNSTESSIVSCSSKSGNLSSIVGEHGCVLSSVRKDGDLGEGCVSAFASAVLKESINSSVLRC